MLHVTADIYSGRPNPSWLATDDAEVRAILRELGKNQSLVAADASAAIGGLGELRGFQVEVHSDEIALGEGVQPSLYLPVGAEATGAAHELAERLLALATSSAVEAASAASGSGSVEMADYEMLRSLLDHKLGRAGSLTMADSRGGPGVGEADSEDGDAEAGAEAARPSATCMVEYGSYNPNFWNNDASIRQKNNCYNYASNKRTDTFAQPGRGSGQIYTAITCSAVSAAARRDGLHRRYVCFPDAEKPRYLVALVVAPGPGFIDFHWYRKNSQGFWSHKPGGTAVRNVDNSNRVITNPETCNRGPYTHFCGYFYTCRSQRIR